MQGAFANEALQLGQADEALGTAMEVAKQAVLVGGQAVQVEEMVVHFRESDETAGVTEEAANGGTEEAAGAMGHGAAGVQGAAGATEQGADGDVVTTSSTQAGDGEAAAAVPRGGEAAWNGFAEWLMLLGQELAGAYQITTSLQLSMPVVRWPAAFTDCADLFRSIFSFDFVTDWGATLCNMQAHSCFRTQLIMIVFLVLIVSMPAVAAMLHPVLRQRRWSPTRLELFRNRVIKVILLTFLIAHAPLSAKLLQMIACRSFDGKRYLEADLSISCASDQYTNECIVWAAAFLPLYTAGIPLLIFMIIVRYQSPYALQLKHPPAGLRPLLIKGQMACDEFESFKCRWHERSGFLCIKYEDDYWWWESVEIVRKFILSGLLIFIAPGSVLQPTAGLLISVSFLLLHTRHSPMKFTSIDILAFISQTCTFLLMLYSLADMAGVIEEGDISQATVDTILLIRLLAPVASAAVIISASLTCLVGQKRKHERALDDERTQSSNSMHEMSGQLKLAASNDQGADDHLKLAAACHQGTGGNQFPERIRAAFALKAGDKKRLGRLAHR